MQVHTIARNRQDREGTLTDKTRAKLLNVELRGEHSVCPTLPQHFTGRRLRHHRSVTFAVGPFARGKGSGTKHPEQRQYATGTQADGKALLGDAREPKVRLAWIRAIGSVKAFSPAIQ